MQIYFLLHLGEKYFYNYNIYNMLHASVATICFFKLPYSKRTQTQHSCTHIQHLYRNSLADVYAPLTHAHTHTQIQHLPYPAHSTRRAMKQIIGTGDKLNIKLAWTCSIQQENFRYWTEWQSKCYSADCCQHARGVCMYVFVDVVCDKCRSMLSPSIYIYIYIQRERDLNICNEMIQLVIYIIYYLINETYIYIYNSKSFSKKNDSAFKISLK